MSRQEAAPVAHEHLSCEIMITGRCNMGCDYCTARNLPSMHMSAEIGRNAIDMFVELAAGGKSIEFVFTGGEPLMALGLLAELTRHARRSAIKAGMQPSFVVKTNGTLLNNRALDYLKLSEAGLVVSIDGTSSTHDSHRLTLAHDSTHSLIIGNLKNAIQNEIDCSVSVTVHPDAASKVLENVRYLYELGIKQVSIGPAYGTVSWSADQIEALSVSLLDVASFLHDVHRIGGSLNVEPLSQNADHISGKLSGVWGCNAASTNLAFLPDGTIAGCSALAMLAWKFPDLLLGDVLGGLDQQAVDRMVQLARADITSRVKCQSCETADNCSGGCLAFNYAVGGLPFAPPKIYCSTIATIPIAHDLAWGADPEQKPVGTGTTLAVSGRLH